ncbi:mechanosensitive ion channel family protein [Ostreibacterium oceani]|uniref:Small-conductance mechanosensitive channel n=1 Tax=Ostreibacterium oceani TaxID=2654998 RepID=A0A6N7EV27_9GAMM|nr:mechanosensitive ion channel family protein [Ostreibacterium oceani]MPV85823.1 mechanosensitive ion channel [Ostreibacterium oceani]
MQNGQGVWLIGVSLLVLVMVLVLLNRFLASQTNTTIRRYSAWYYGGVIFVGLAFIFAFLPIAGEAKNSVFSLIALLVTAVIAISSTTFASNMMAGFMLRVIKNFKPGDFIEIGEHFGRVSDMGLLHTEIQTRDRSLTTLPNLFVITHPLTVIPSDKAIVSATVSIGYDVSHHQVCQILEAAAAKTGLLDAFSQVIDLGDFSVNYRVAGFLGNPKLLLGARSNLRKQIIDSLHEGGVEIVSPTFMNQRQYRSDEMFMAEVKAYQRYQNNKSKEADVFDKAEEAEAVQALKEKLHAIDAALKNAKDEAQTAATTEHLEAQRTNTISQIELMEEKTKQES